MTENRGSLRGGFSVYRGSRLASVNLLDGQALGLTKMQSSRSEGAMETSVVQRSQGYKD